MTHVFISLPLPEYHERSSFVAKVYFRGSTDAAEAPTTVDYRIDGLTTNTEIQGWTSATPAVQVDLSITPTQNRIVNQRNTWEKRQITVSANRGLADETRDIVMYKILNTGGFDE